METLLQLLYEQLCSIKDKRGKLTDIYNACLASEEYIKLEKLKQDINTKIKTTDGKITELEDNIAKIETTLNATKIPPTLVNLVLGDKDILRIILWNVPPLDRGRLLRVSKIWHNAGYETENYTGIL